MHDIAAGVRGALSRLVGKLAACLSRLPWEAGGNRTLRLL